MTLRIASIEAGFRRKTPQPFGRALWLWAAAGLILLYPVSIRASDDCERRAEELLSQMSLEEKIGQMTQVDMNALADRADIEKYCLGSMLSGGDSDPPEITAKGWRKACEEYQSWALKTRLKIPLLYGIDAVHGHNNVDGAVIFPHNIGLGATHNPDLVERAARVTAEEIAGTGIHWAFAPCVTVPQDERWGRTYEGFGETPELVAELGAAQVRGFEAALPPASFRVLACAKHYLGDGGTQGGVDQGNAVCDEATVRRLYVPPYAAAVKAGVGSIMVSYSSWNGKKMSANKYLLTDVLKGELGFRGFLISDWAAIDQISPDYKQDIEASVNAGMDMVMIPNGPGKRNNYVEFIRLLKELVDEKRVAADRVDDAVRRILRVKFQSGLFEHPYAEPSLTAEVGSSAHRQVARECVRESLVLLKNARQVLPLSKELKHLAIVGRGADNLGMQCGGWTIDWQGRDGEVTHGGTTLLAAIRQTVSPATQVSYSVNGQNLEGAEAAIVVVGEKPYAEMKGDRRDLKLNPEDVALIKKVKASGVAVVTLIYSGRPLVLGDALEASDAVVAAWLPGTEGQGVADVVFGDYKPTGKLPRHWPRNNEQLACDFQGEPQFPLGYGLSY